MTSRKAFNLQTAILDATRVPAVEPYDGQLVMSPSGRTLLQIEVVPGGRMRVLNGLLIMRGGRYVHECSQFFYSEEADDVDLIASWMRDFLATFGLLSSVSGRAERLARRSHGSRRAAKLPKRRAAAPPAHGRPTARKR